MGIKERLLVFIKYKEMSKYAFEKSIGVSNGFINSIKKSVGSDKLDEISDVYPELNINWLLTGIGAMLKPQSGKLAKDNIFYLPYISVAEYSNYIEKYNDDSYIQSLPQLIVKHIPLNPSTVKYAFEVANNSMLDETVRLSYAMGDVVFADNINGDYTRIVERKTYVVVLKNEIRLCFCELADNDKLILSSRDKALFPDKTISINEALQIFFVIGGSFSR